MWLKMVAYFTSAGISAGIDMSLRVVAITVRPSEEQQRDTWSIRSRTIIRGGCDHEVG